MLVNQVIRNKGGGTLMGQGFFWSVGQLPHLQNPIVDKGMNCTKCMDSASEMSAMVDKWICPTAGPVKLWSVWNKYDDIIETTHGFFRGWSCKALDRFWPTLVLGEFSSSDILETWSEVEAGIGQTLGKRPLLCHGLTVIGMTRLFCNQLLFSMTAFN